MPGPISNEAEKPSAIDTGLACLVSMARYHNVAADPQQISHYFGTVRSPSAKDSPRTDCLDEKDLVRAARKLGLKASCLTADTGSLEKLALPAMAKSKAGEFFIIAKLADTRVLIHKPGEQKPQVLSVEAFSKYWNGQLILMTRRSLLPGMRGKFDISWFIPAIIKYKKILIQVLVASFFIQLFALITPLFFQVIIDKVLVHQGLTTLDVLCFALLVVSLFDVLLNGLRSYVFSHTTNRA